MSVYWYQLIWVPSTGALCWIGCLLLRNKPTRSARPAVPVFGHVTYIAIAALILNLIVATALTPVFRKDRAQDGYDETRPADYFADPAPVPAAASEAGTPGRPAEPVAGNRVVFAPSNGQMTTQRPTATSPHARHRRL
ncbi:MAG TPA: hypothetical protein VIY52_20305 [Streptosporangiaceae bacterium]